MKKFRKLGLGCGFVIRSRTLAKLWKMTRLTVLLILLGMGQALALSSYAQSTTLNLNFKNANLEEVLAEIENQSEFFFLYNRDLIDVEQKVDVEVRNKKINEILDNLFQEKDIRYFLFDRQIVLSNQYGETGITGQENITVQQQPAVTGTVTDEAGQPLPGVTVVVKGTTQGTVTNADGEYRITDIPENATLQFSFVGMLTQEVVVGRQKEINVNMTLDAIGIEEVVAIGYGTVKRSDLTGSVSTVSSEDMNIGPVTSLEQGLQGKAAGVQVIQQSGAPGGGLSIRIRGAGSVLGGTEPLYVVDGFPIYSSNDFLSSNRTEDVNELGFLNPANIESVEILKGASATAIYGSRGANGVVLITTKKGRVGKTVVELDISTGIQQVTRKLDLLNTAQMEQIRKDFEGDAYVPLPRPYASTDIDWQNQIFRNAPMQDYMLNISGGSQKTKFMLSGNFVDQDGIIIESGYNKANVSLNLNHKLNDRIRITNNIITSKMNFNGSYTAPWEGGSNGSILTNTSSLPPYFPLYDENGNIDSYEDWTLYQIERRLMKNGVAIAKGQKNKRVYNRVLENFSLEIDIAKNLMFKTTAGIDYGNLTIDFLRGTLYVKNDKDSRIVAERTNRDKLNWINENTLTYSNIFGEHNLNVLAGFTQQQETLRSSNLEGIGFPNDALGTDALQLAEEQYISSYRQKWDMVSWLGRVQYSFANKYLINASIRADGSSKFGKNSKWGVFPSGAVAWKITEEEFMKDLEAIYSLKFRASYGVTGNQEIGTYRSVSRLASGSAAFNNAMVPSIYLQDIPDQDLSWEQTEQINVGIDLGIFDNMLSFTAEYFKKTTNDLLISLPQPLVSGISTLTRNVGTLENKGWEFSLTSHNFSGDFSWETNLNVSSLENKIIDLGGLEEYILNSFVRLTPGKPLGAFYGYKTNGLWQLSEADEAASYDAQPGDLKIVDLNNDNAITTSDKTYLGSPFPDFEWGLLNNFSYKRFDLSVFFRGTHGQKIFFPERSLNGLYTNGLVTALDSWTINNQDTDIPRRQEIIYHDPNDRNVTDGSFIRLQNVRLGYTIPSSSIEWLQNAYLYCSVQNLYVWTDYIGYDPEVNTAGSNNSAVYSYDDMSYPKARTYTLGLKVKF